MKTKNILPLLKRMAIGVGALGALIGGVAFLPGDIEGQYRNVGVRCMCDSVNFLQFRDGKIVYYSSGHPPAKIIGHYSGNSDGTFDMYYDSYKPGKANELLGHAYPHLFLTRFSWTTDDNVEWGVKHPKMFTVRKTIAEQEITCSYINADRSVATTFYDFLLRPLRTELKLPKQNTPAEAVPSDGHKPSGHVTPTGPTAPADAH